MKKMYYTLCLGLLSFYSFSQSPSTISYQAVVRNSSGAVSENQQVSLRISILKTNPSGTTVYSETHTATTNDFGLVNLGIGGGTPVSGSFANIDWGSDDYFVKIELDHSGGSNYQAMGTSQLLSAPYSLYSDRCFTQRTFIEVSCEGSSSLALGTTYIKVADLGDFTKILDGTAVEITYLGRLYISSMTGTGGVFELRVDDNATTNGRARANFRAAEAGGAGVPYTLAGVFDGLSAGQHTVNLYVKVSNGTGTGALTDPGCWNVAQLNIEERY